MRIFAPYRAVVVCCIGGLVVALCACSPKTGSTAIPGADRANSARPATSVVVTPAPPLTMSEISNRSPRIHSALPADASVAPGAVRVHGPRTLPPSRASSTNRSRHNATSSADGHGAFQDWIGNNTAFTHVNGVYATQAVYANYVFPNTGNTALYAPTLKAPDPDSLEITIVYLPHVGGFIGVWDFADPNCQFCDVADLSSPAVQDAYVRSFTAPDGFTFQGVTVQNSADFAGVYHAYIFNYGANGYDEVAREAATMSAGSGWDMFEYYMGPPGSLCVATPGPVYSLEINELRAGTWYPLDSTNSVTWLVGDDGCFNGPDQPIYYANGTFGTNSSWVVYTGTQRVGTTWQQLPGAALDVAIGRHNDLWVIGSDNNLYSWNGSSFVQYPGIAGTRVASDLDGNPWVVNAAGNIFTHRGGTWQQVTGCALDVGANAGAVWVIGCDHGVYSWNGAYTGNTFARAAGSGNRITVDAAGNPWFVDANGSIFFEKQGVVQQVQGCALDVGANTNGLWVIGCSQGIYYWTGALTGNTFTQVSGGGTNIAVSTYGLPVVSNSALGIYQRI